MSALQDIALDMEAQAATAPAPAPASPTGRWQRWFAQLSIGGKITLFFTGNLGFALLAGLFVVGGYVELGQRAERVRTTHAAALEAQRLQSELSEGQRHAELLAATGDPSRARAASEALRRAEAAVATLAQGTADPAQLKQLAEIRVGMADLARQVARPRDAAAISAAGDRLTGEAKALAETLGTRANAASESGAALISRLLVLWIGLATLLTLITLFAVRYFNRTVGATLKAMAQQMSAIAAGERNIAISGKDRADGAVEIADGEQGDEGEEGGEPDPQHQQPRNQRSAAF
jgi:methyl-accepting chemotaxis protein